MKLEGGWWVCEYGHKHSNAWMARNCDRAWEQDRQTRKEIRTRRITKTD